MDTQSALTRALTAWEESYAAALDHLVELAVSLSTGQRSPERKSPLRVVRRTELEHIVAERDSLESWTISARQERLPEVLAEHRAVGRIVIPYRYSAAYDEEQLILAAGGDARLTDKLGEALHEKRHSRRSEGGFTGTRLDEGYFELTSLGSRVADAGRMEEAACDEMAAYDLQVLSHLAEQEWMKEALRKEVLLQRQESRELASLIEQRRDALAAGDPLAEVLLIRFGELIAETEEAKDLYRKLGDSVAKGELPHAAALKERIALLLVNEQPEAAAMVLRGERSLEDVLHCQMAHRAHYSNERIGPLVHKLMRIVAPAPALVAAGQAKNPFMDLMGIHSSLAELEDTIAYAGRVTEMGKRALLSETERCIKRLSKRWLDQRYEGLRHLYILTNAARKQGIPLDFERVQQEFSQSFQEDVDRYLFLSRS